MADVITDPEVVNGPRQIAPSGAINVVAANSTPERTLESLEDYGVVQNFEGFTGFASGDTGFRFTANPATRPDVKISFGASFENNSGAAIDNPTFLTSAPTAMRLQLKEVAGKSDFVVTIDFGKWNDSGTTFDGSTNAVSAAGFTLSTPRERLGSVSAITATFLSDDGRELAVQEVTPADFVSGNNRIYFGYQTGDANIGSVVLTITAGARGDSMGPLFGFDDLGFSSINAH